MNKITENQLKQLENTPYLKEFFNKTVLELLQYVLENNPNLNPLNSEFSVKFILKDKDSKGEGYTMIGIQLPLPKLEATN